VGTRSRARGRPEAALGPMAPREVVIADVAHLLVSETSPAAVLAAVADALGQVVPHDALTLHTADASRRLLRPALVRDSRPGKALTARPLRFGEGLVGSVAQSRKPRLVASIGVLPAAEGATGAGPGPHSLIVNPLTARGELKGVLCLYRFGPNHAFTEEEFKTAIRFSVLAALAIDNADIRSKLESLAMTDHLTGLYNHRYFQERLLEEVSRANRGAASVSLLIYDIDDFKDVNDSYGHLLGDQVLQGVGSAAGAICRIEDPVCRIGGEEFGVILPGQAVARARVLAERIRRSVVDLSFPMKTRVTVSVGLAEAPLNASSPRDLFACADLALRTAKAHGKNRVCVYAGTALGPRRESSSDHPLSGRWEILAEGIKTGGRARRGAEHLDHAARNYNHERMIKTWLVRLELARDDDGALSDEGIDALTHLLAANVKPVITRGDSGSVLVQMTVEARDDMAARSAAERMLRDGANSVWAARGLPPFTIAFVGTAEAPK